MSNLLVIPVSQEGRLGCLLGRPEYPISYLPGRSSPVEHVLVSWAPIDGVPGVTPGAEGVEPGLRPGTARNGQETLLASPDNVLCFLNQSYHIPQY